MTAPASERELQDSQRALLALADISKAFAEASFDLQQIFDAIAKKVVEVLGDACFVRLLAGDGETLKTMSLAHRDPDARKEMLASLRIQSGAREGVTGKVLAEGKSVLLAEIDPVAIRQAISSVDHDFIQRFPMRSLVAVPVSADGKTFGVIAAVRYTPGHPFTQNDQLLMEELADRSSLAIKSARQHEELKAERQRLAAVLEQMPSAVAIVDPTGKPLLSNAQNAAIFGRPVPSVQGVAEYSTLYRAVHPDGRELAAEEWPLARSLVKGETIRGEELEIVRADGSHGFIRSNSAPVRDEAGQVVAGIVTYDDVTEERKARDGRTFLLQAGALLAGSLDYEKTLVQLTQLAVPTLADWCSIDVVEGGKVRRLAVAHVDPDKVQLARDWEEKYPTDYASDAGVGRVLRTGELQWAPHIPDALLTARITDPQRLADTRKLGLRSYVAVPLKARGEVLGVLGLVFAESGRTHTQADVKLAEELALRAATAMDNALLYRKAQQALEELRKRSELEQQLIAIVSHDLRNPLDAIGMSASLLMRRGGLDASQGQAIGRIMSASDRADRLIRDFLDFTLARSTGKMPIARAHCDLFRLARAAVDEVHLSHPERKATVVCVGNGEGQFDADRVSQLIGNLVSNAFQHSMGTEHVLVTVEGTPAAVTLSVQNSGPPIPVKNRAQLFEPFKRTEGKGGAGLGLYIVKLIAEGHGGRVDFESSEAKGTLFTVVLPRK